MSDKKRTTVTTIETHEVWIIRKAAPEPPDDSEMFTPLEIAQPVSPGGVDSSSETDKEEES